MDILDMSHVLDRYWSCQVLLQKYYIRPGCRQNTDHSVAGEVVLGVDQVPVILDGPLVVCKVVLERLSTPSGSVHCNWSRARKAVFATRGDIRAEVRQCIAMYCSGIRHQPSVTDGSMLCAPRRYLDIV